eukprot:scaffold3901_cov390-Prasinococcus_capsulatus_cf.AAC.9
MPQPVLLPPGLHERALGSEPPCCSRAAHPLRLQRWSPSSYCLQGHWDGCCGWRNCLRPERWPGEPTGRRARSPSLTSGSCPEFPPAMRPLGDPFRLPPAHVVHEGTCDCTPPRQKRVARRSELQQSVGNPIASYVSCMALRGCLLGRQSTKPRSGSQGRASRKRNCEDSEESLRTGTRRCSARPVEGLARK